MTTNDETLGSVDPLGSDPRPPLSAGDIAPPCALPALHGARVDLRADGIAGNPIVILFCPRFLPAITEAVAAMSAAQQRFAAAGARLFAVTLEPAKVAAAQNIRFPVLIDGDVHFVVADRALTSQLVAALQHLPVLDFELEMFS